MLRRIGTAAAVVLCLLLPSAALASGTQVIKDCADDGVMSKKYSQADYSAALKQMPADLREYSDCADVIRRAMLGQSIPGSTGTPQNPYAGATPQEVVQAKKDIANAVKTGNRPQRIERKLIRPGALAYRKVSAGVTNLPHPLLVIVVLVLIATGLAIGRAVRSRP
jgi:hypothetical protein